VGTGKDRGWRVSHRLVVDTRIEGAGAGSLAARIQLECADAWSYPDTASGTAGAVYWLNRRRRCRRPGEIMAGPLSDDEDDEQARRDGFGLAVPGVWNPRPLLLVRNTDDCSSVLFTCVDSDARGGGEGGGIIDLPSPRAATGLPWSPAQHQGVWRDELRDENDNAITR